MALVDEQKALYLDEMRQSRTFHARRRSLARRRLTTRLRGLGYGLWGVRGHVRKRINEETFWRSVRLLESVSIAYPVQVARGTPPSSPAGCSSG